MFVQVSKTSYNLTVLDLDIRYSPLTYKIRQLDWSGDVTCLKWDTSWLVMRLSFETSPLQSYVITPYQSWRFDLYQFGFAWNLMNVPMDLVKGSWMELSENAVANILKNWKITLEQCQGHDMLINRWPQQLQRENGTHRLDLIIWYPASFLSTAWTVEHCPRLELD